MSVSGALYRKKIDSDLVLYFLQVILGHGDKKTTCGIRDTPHADVIHAQVDVKNVLSCKDFRTFWMKWDSDSTITVS